MSTAVDRRNAQIRLRDAWARLNRALRALAATPTGQWGYAAKLAEVKAAQVELRNTQAYRWGDKAND